MRKCAYVYKYISFSGNAGEMYTDSVSAVNAHGLLQNMRNWSASDTERYVCKMCKMSQFR